MNRTLALAFFGLSTLPAFGQRVDPLIGSWRLNVEKSTATYPLPKSQTLTWAGAGKNFTNTAEGVDSQGRAFKEVFIHVYDGKPHPTTGTPNVDSSAYTRLGNTLSITRFKNGKPVTVGQGLIVLGKTYTFIVGGIDANTQPFYGAVVYDRQ